MWDSPEEAFKELDEREFTFFSGALAAYRESLMKQGFTRREAFRLVEAYSRFIYDISVEELINSSDSDVDDEGDDVL